MALCGRSKYILEFTTSGDYFPMRYDDSYDPEGSSKDNIGKAAGFKFKSSSDQRITYDLNDGGEPIVVDNVANVDLGVVHYLTDGYTGRNKKGRFYLDGNTGDRTIRVTFEKPLDIISFFIGYTRLKGDLPKNLGNFINMTGWSIRYIKGGGLMHIPSEVLNMKNLVFPGFTSAFNTEASFYTVYPIEFLDSKITNIEVSGTHQGDYANSLDTVNINNNWDKFHLLKDTLLGIKCQSSSIGDGDLRSSIVDSWVQCTNLKELVINTNYTKTPYPQLNRLTQLKSIDMGGGNGFDFVMESWGDLSALVNLETFNGATAYKTPTTMPSYWLQMPKLRRILLDWNYTEQARWDSAIDNLYTFVTSNALLSNDDETNPVVMRNQNISMTAKAVGSITEYIIQGTYQQPQGYIQGVSNGNPASQLEKIWVLANQYKVLVKYTDNR